MNQDPQRAIRLRDNKRKHRQRKREYVADLERLLAEARRHGVQATKEVQVAAQRVVWENSRLRQILRAQGRDDSAIDALIYKDGPFQPAAAPPPEAVAQPAAAAAPRRPFVLMRPASRTDPLTHEAHEAHEVPDADSEGVEPSPTAPPPAASANPGSDASASRQGHPEMAAPGARPAPCKILTLLAGNPNADITQLPAPVDEKGGCEEPDGVECVRAREMLLSFATTEKQLDAVAYALEQGCVKDMSGGGCHVKAGALLDTLDRIL